MNSIDEIMALHTGHWFDKDTLRFFGSRISKRVYPAPNGTYFVSSERNGDSPRLYTVRLAFLDAGKAEIRTVGEFQGFVTSAAAHRAAAALAEALSTEA